MAPMEMTGGPLTAATPPTDRIAADLAEVQKVGQALSGLKAAARLVRYPAEERQGLGVTNSATQLKTSLACLRLLRRRPDLVARLQPGTAPPGEGSSPAGTLDRWTAVVALRLGLCEARRLVAPLLTACERGEVLLLGDMTGTCDAIEDRVAERLATEGLSPADRRRLQARFVDPGRLAQLTEESATARLSRRGRRSAAAARELAARRRRLGLILGRQRLLGGRLPEEE